MSKADILIQYAVENNNTISHRDGMDLIGHTYYSNAGKYVSEVFGRLVKSGKMERMGKGLFKLKTASNKVDHPNQIKLL